MTTRRARMGKAPLRPLPRASDASLGSRHPHRTPRDLARRAWGLVGLVLIAGSTAACAKLQVSMRTEGEVNITMPDEVAYEYHCDKRPLPFFEVEKNELLPERARPGEELSHRFVYVMCPKKATEVVSGTLDTRILFRGEIIFQEVISQDLKPGRWRIDTFIPLPETAKPGVYALQVDFTSGQGKLSESADFIVKSLE